MPQYVHPLHLIEFLFTFNRFSLSGRFSGVKRKSLRRMVIWGKRHTAADGSAVADSHIALTMKTTNSSWLKDIVCLAQASTYGRRMATGVGLPMICLHLLYENVHHTSFLPMQTFPPGRREEAHEILEVNFTYLGSWNLQDSWGSLPKIMKAVDTAGGGDFDQHSCGQRQLNLTINYAESYRAAVFENLHPCWGGLLSDAAAFGSFLFL